MSRTKNRGIARMNCYLFNAIRWDLGEYIRLSKEDANRGRDDSNSVANQKKLLGEYYEQHIDEFESRTTYVDDGHTGTDTDRDDFQRMLGDIMSKKINCVIVKDLSRLSRNYTDAGSLIENLFVRMNVRFISLAEGVDSYKNPDSISNILVPITNVMNDNYCYQTSKKIRQVFDYKRRNGEYIGSYAPYGYLKDPNDKHALIIDEEAAAVVKDIFRMFLQGKSKNGIVRYLNEHGVMCPTAYKRSKGMKYYSPSAVDRPLWSVVTIDTFLKNRIYTGDMVQGRQRIKSYKVHVLEKVPEEEWFIVENTHEAIIDKETFEKVQQLLKKDTRTAPKKKQVYLFSGFLRCADCERSMRRSTVKSLYVYYFCSTYKSLSKLACTSHAIKHDHLEAAVLYAIQLQVYLAVSYTETIAKINNAPLQKSRSARLDSQVATKEKELAKIIRYKQSLYQDWKDGEITRNDYRRMNEDYEKQAEAIQIVLDTLNKERTELGKGVDTENLFLATFRKYQNINTLTREVIVELVDHIKIHENGNISVKFKFADEYRRVVEYIEVNTHEEVG